MDKSDTKSLLLSSGLDLFAQAPYEGVSVQDIVAKIHVTKPTLYHYFNSKLGFYQAVFTYYVTPFMHHTIELAEFHNDFTHNLNEIALYSLDFMHRFPKIFSLLDFAAVSSESTETHPFLQKELPPFYQSILKLFNDAVVQHGNLKDKADMSAWLFIHGIRAEILAVKNGIQTYSPDLAYKFVHQFMYGLFA